MYSVTNTKQFLSHFLKLKFNEYGGRLAAKEKAEMCELKFY
jgi:hypothetical protein